MKEGKLVPMQTTISLLKEAMAASEETTFLIDGFPRALDQADAFEKQVLFIIGARNAKEFVFFRATRAHKALH